MVVDGGKKFSESDMRTEYSEDDIKLKKKKNF